MPELPEVETIARGLSAQISGQRVRSVRLHTPSIIRAGNPASLTGRTLTGASRRAKLLIVGIDDGRVVTFHLKMTGRVWLAGPGQALPKHAHLVLDLESTDQVVFEDARRFGFCGIFTPQELGGWEFYANLGPEPLDCPPGTLVERLADRAAGIKALLLNQTVIAGVGNIYADESLFAARIHPASRTANIPRKRLFALCTALQNIMRAAIRAGGSTISDYRNAYGKNGLFQDHFMAYGKKGAPCPGCAQPFLTIKVAGRTSTHCPRCQILY